MKISIDSQELNVLSGKFISVPLTITGVDNNGVGIVVKPAAAIPELKLVIKPCASKNVIPIDVDALGFSTHALADWLAKVANWVASAVDKDVTSILAQQFPAFIERESRSRIIFDLAAFCRSKNIPLSPEVQSIELNANKIQAEFILQ